MAISQLGLMLSRINQDQTISKLIIPDDPILSPSQVILDFFQILFQKSTPVLQKNNEFLLGTQCLSYQEIDTKLLRIKCIEVDHLQASALKITLEIKPFIDFRTVKDALECKKIKEKSAMLDLKLICHSKIGKRKTGDKSLSPHISHQRYRKLLTL